jgi:O-antigen/teichoic acid export membrane protein
MSSVMHPVEPVTQTFEASDVVRRATEGARLLTARGVVMRAVSVASNLVLIALVSPREFGLYAIARGTLGLIQNAMELGFEQALVRRRRIPVSADFSAVLGLQLSVLAVFATLAIVRPQFLFRYSPIDARWYGWLAAVIITMAVVPMGTGARVRLERDLQYHRLAAVDILNVLVQNFGLLFFALIGHFAIGVFVVLMLMFLSVNVLLVRWSPGPRPTFAFGRLRSIARDAFGFTATAWTQVAREFVTPLVIGALFGLEMAGLWAFTLRVGQLLDVTIAGFQQATVPAAVRVRDDPQALRLLATNALAGAAVLALPVSAIMVAGLPVLGLLWPKWEPAIQMAQLYLAVYSVAGVLTASLYGVAIAVRGSTAALAGPLASMVITWSGFFILARMGSHAIAWMIAPMLMIPALTLIPLTPADIRPSVSHPAVFRAMGAAATAYAVYAIGVALRAPAVTTALCATAGALFWARPSIVVAKVRNFPIRWRMLSSQNPT